MVVQRSDAERTWPSDARLTTIEALRALREGELTVLGRLAEASNVSLYCELRVPWALPGRVPFLHVMYKPVQGERPLEDFLAGSLAGREVAAWLLSEATGWGLVPPTILRDGPFGEGMVQLWIEVDPTVDVLTLILARDDRLRRMAIFDVLANNADRKGAHILPTADGDLLGCDHGICFAAEPKLRTVLWGWRGEPLLADERATVERVRQALDGAPKAGEGSQARLPGLRDELEGLLDDDETLALGERVARLLADDRLPLPDEDRRVIPWPPF